MIYHASRLSKPAGTLSAAGKFVQGDRYVPRTTRANYEKQLVART
jgi:hypothetical protein